MSPLEYPDNQLSHLLVSYGDRVVFVDHSTTR